MFMSKLLGNINSPQDIRKLNVSELGQLCAEVREYMIECCSKNPGHLASSLGAVELIVGTHYVYNTPYDKFVFDVGHQAYAHKILTGRREAFALMRTKEGISGFPNIFESEYDSFSVGHSSTSISAALGLAEASRVKKEDRHVIALIGDGSLTGGLAFEGLNNAGSSENDILVVLNDNNHSIDNNTGGLHNYLLKVTTSGSYNRVKDHIWNSLGENGFRDFIQRWIKSIKAWLIKSYGGDIFEALGIRYFGPIDGNDIAKVVSTMQRMQKIKGPKILHCITTKGKGYAPAEKDPTTWHAPGKFNPETGERIKTPYSADRYQDVFGQTLCELADMDERVVGVTPAMASGCGMSLLASLKPERFYDVGIEEEHAVTFSAGLASGGLKPFCNIYSSFSQRAYDQIIHDVAMQKLPVVLCFDRAGLVGEDGATHHGMFDLSAYRAIPNTIISSPADEIELKNLMFTALKYDKGPFIIRYPRGTGEGAGWRKSEYKEYGIGKAEEIVRGSKIALVAIGPCVGRCIEAAGKAGDIAGVYNFRFLKPFDTDMLDFICSRYGAVITVEDGTIKGGLYGAVCEYVAARDSRIHVKGIGVDDRFIPQARQSEQRSEFCLDTAGILSAIEVLRKKFE